MEKELYLLDNYLQRLLVNAEAKGNHDMIDILKKTLISVDELKFKKMCEAVDKLNGIL